MKKRTPQEKSKFLSYFDLWDAFQKPGCPICALVERRSWQYLDALLYERVNDPGTRRELWDSLGFCNWHAWKTLEIPNCALGLGIIYEDILKHIRGRLTKVRDSFPMRVPFLSKLFWPGNASLQPPPLGSKKRCPACQNAKLFETIYLGILVDFISEADFERQFGRSSGICFLHLVAATEEYHRHKNLPLLVEKQIEKFEFLGNEVAEFVRKQDYTYAAEPRGAEADSWKRSLEMVVGKREIFPGQMRWERGSEKQPIIPSPWNPPKNPSLEMENPEDLQATVEKLQFENGKLLRKCEELKEEHVKESSRASALHHIAWKTTEDNKTLKTNLAGANAQAQGYAGHFARLNKEIERLKELLKKQEQGEKVRDKI